MACMFSVQLLLVEIKVLVNADRFLLPRIYLTSLEDAPNKKAVKDSLARLRQRMIDRDLEGTFKTLELAYDNMMERVDRQPRPRKDIAFRALVWLTFTKRQLKTIELQHALAVEE